MRNKGGEVKLCALPDHIKKLLIITKLSSIFAILENEEQGIESFKK
jgi:anti-anti-sigma regulatory factor